MSKWQRKVHSYAPGTFTGSYDSEALTSSMDNVLTLGLAHAARDAAATSGDFIDQGLVLVRRLREEGFEVRIAE